MMLSVLTIVRRTPLYSYAVIDPPARRLNGKNPGSNGEVDWDINNPLGVFPCKGYRPQKSVMTVKAGQSIDVEFGGTANHDGGHCQFALSYDQDKTFIVIGTIYRNCIQTKGPNQVAYTHRVRIPENAPAGKVTFAWSWINAIGNREYYMSCSDITITSPRTNKQLTGPELLVANLPGYVQFPEFAGNKPDFREKFKSRRRITVTAP
jgi:hypothetical protein